MQHVEHYGVKVYNLNDSTYPDDFIASLEPESLFVISTSIEHPFNAFEEKKIIELRTGEFVSMRLHEETLCVYASDQHGEQNYDINIEIDAVSVNESNIQMFKGVIHQTVHKDKFISSSLSFLHDSIFEYSESVFDNDEDVANRISFAFDAPTDTDGSSARNIEQIQSSERHIVGQKRLFVQSPERRDLDRNLDEGDCRVAHGDTEIVESDSSIRYRARKNFHLRESDSDSDFDIQPAANNLSKKQVPNASERETAEKLFSTELVQSLKAIESYQLILSMNRHLIPVEDVAFSRLIRMEPTKQTASPIIVGFERASQFIITSEHSSRNELQPFLENNKVPMIILSEDEAVRYALSSLSASQKMGECTSEEKIRHLRAIAVHLGIDFLTARCLKKKDLSQILNFFDQKTYPMWLGRLSFYTPRINDVIVKFLKQPMKTNAHSVARLIPKSIRVNERCTLDILDEYDANKTSLDTLKKELKAILEDPLCILKGVKVNHETANKFLVMHPEDNVVRFLKELRPRKRGYDDKQLTELYQSHCERRKQQIPKYIHESIKPTFIAISETLENSTYWASPALEHQFVISVNRHLITGVKVYVELPEMVFRNGYGYRCSKVTFNLFKEGVLVNDEVQVLEFMKEKDLLCYDLYKPKELVEMVEKFDGSCAVFDKNDVLECIFKLSKEACAVRKTKKPKTSGTVQQLIDAII